MTTSFINNDARLFAPISMCTIAGYAHLDTGAGHSSVIQTYADGLPEVGLRVIQGALDRANMPQVSLTEVSFLGKTFQNVIVDIMPDDIGGLNMLPFNVVMALGSDLLLHHPLHLNFERNEIAFCEQAEVERRITTRTPADFSFGPPMMKMTIGDNCPLTAVFDTGAGLSVMNQRLLDSARREIVADEPLKVEDSTGAKQMIPTFRCSTLRMMDYPLSETRFLVIDITEIEAKIGLQIDFVAGINTMMGKEWLINREKRFIGMLSS